jgi:hypothetical protein
MDNFQKYEKMRDQGASAKQVYLTAKKDGLDPIALIRLLRKVFCLSLPEAKEVTVVSDGLAPSLVEYQERFIPRLKKALESRAAENTGKRQGKKKGIPARIDRPGR